MKFDNRLCLHSDVGGFLKAERREGVCDARKIIGVVAGYVGKIMPSSYAPITPGVTVCYSIVW